MNYDRKSRAGILRCRRNKQMMDMRHFANKNPEMFNEVVLLFGPAVATHRFFDTLNKIERRLNE